MLIANLKMEDVAQLGNPHPEGVGIEIEWENFRQRSHMGTLYWRTDGDGSLRNGGIEFISRILDGQEDVDDALLELHKHILDESFQYEVTYRCGIHVHLSITDLTVGQLASLFTYYALIEPALMSFCGEERQDNIFCVPWYHCSGQIRGPRSLPTMQQRRRETVLHNLLQGGNKYMALNYLPINVLGTVELRMAPSWAMMSDVSEWVEICMALREKARTYEQPSDVLDTYERNGLDYMLTEVGLVPGAYQYQDAAIDVAYALAGEDDAEVDDWDIPNIMLEPTIEPEERRIPLYDLARMRIDEMLDRQPPDLHVDTDDELFEGYDYPEDYDEDIEEEEL